MKKLRISDELSLPLDWIQLATVVYGARGAGKTSFGRVAAEEATKAHQRFCAIDLKGDWYGLKSSADGKSDGIPVVVFGGDHEDVPLEDGAGAFVGETVAGLEQSCILDFENFSKGKRTRFLAEFFETLYHRNREPLLLLLDESQSYAPQKPGPEEARTLGAIQDLVKLGRKHGIGPVLFTQRGAGLNKEVSELCDLLVAFRTPGPLDQDRIKDWLDANTTKAQRDEVMGQLSGLPTGTAVFASGHPELKIFGVFPVRRPETFDSSATPKVGQRRREPKRLATPDLEVLRTKMAAAIERKAAEDPKALRAKIAQLEKELSKKAPAAPVVERVEVPMFDTEAFDELQRKLRDDLLLALNNGKGALHVYKSKCLETSGAKPGASTGAPRKVSAPPPMRVTNGIVHVDREQASGEHFTNGETKLHRCERALLTVLAQRDGQQTTAIQLAILSGYSAKSGGFANAIGKLRSMGFALGSGDDIRITREGRRAIPRAEPLPVGRALRAYWQAKLHRCEREILETLSSAYPQGLDKAALAERAGYSVTSGGFANALGKLRTLQLISGKGELRMSEDLADG